MSNFVILCVSLGIFMLTIWVESLTQHQFYRPRVARVLGAVSMLLLVAGSVWAPWQEFTNNERFLFMGCLWMAFAIIGFCLRNDALRRAAINQEHYESLRAGIEKIT